ncbi:MAG TPA: HPF/RaiA family ribosome-associated protein [Rudaea sp.]|nr:HPF/RaiA family ribosome-associated protein [Rudaea sp.]
MQLLVHADSNIALTDQLHERLELKVQSAANKFPKRITRIQIYLTDVNSSKSGINDKRCVIEARPAGLAPIAVNHQASTVELAIDGASAKLASVLDSRFGRLGSDRGASPTDD